MVEQEDLEGKEGGRAGAVVVQHQEGGDAGDSTEKGPTKRKRRRPPAYWSSDDNLRDEVAKFWSDLGITSDKVRP